MSSMSREQKAQMKAVQEAKGLAKWLEVDFEVKIFGFTIIKYHFPPQSDTLISNQNV